MGGAAGGVGSALAQPGHQHVSGAGGDGQQRVVAPLAGIAVVAGAVLGQSVSLADVESRSMVRGPSPGPAPAAQGRASSSRLTRSSWRTWPHRKLRRKVPRVDGALTVPPRVQAVPPVRNTSAASMQSPPAMAEATRVISLSPVLARPGAAAQVKVMVNEFPQAQMPGEGGRQEQTGIGHQAVIVKDDTDTVGVVAW